MKRMISSFGVTPKNYTSYRNPEMYSWVLADDGNVEKIESRNSLVAIRLKSLQL